MEQRHPPSSGFFQAVFPDLFVTAPPVRADRRVGSVRVDLLWYVGIMTEAKLAGGHGLGTGQETQVGVLHMTDRRNPHIGNALDDLLE